MMVQAIRLTGVMALVAGATIAVPAQQPDNAGPNRRLEGDWVRIDLEGSGRFGGLTSKFTPAVLTPEAAARGERAAAGAVAPDAAARRREQAPRRIPSACRTSPWRCPARIPRGAATARCCSIPIRAACTSSSRKTKSSSPANAAACGTSTWTAGRIQRTGRRRRPDIPLDATKATCSLSRPSA